MSATNRFDQGVCAMLLQALCLCLKKWTKDWCASLEELVEHQVVQVDKTPDLIDECVFSTHECLYGSLLGSIFERNKRQSKNFSNHFQLSARTRARIHTEYALDQLRKSHQSLDAVADCAASIQLLSCFRTMGDPEGICTPSIRYHQRPVSRISSLVQLSFLLSPIKPEWLTAALRELSACLQNRALACCSLIPSRLTPQQRLYGT